MTAIRDCNTRIAKERKQEWRDKYQIQLKVILDAETHLEKNFDDPAA